MVVHRNINGRDIYAVAHEISIENDKGNVVATKYYGGFINDRPPGFGVDGHWLVDENKKLRLFNSDSQAIAAAFEKAERIQFGADMFR